MSSLRTNWEPGDRDGQQPRSLHLSFLSTLWQASGYNHAPHIANSPAKWRPQTPTHNQPTGAGVPLETFLSEEIKTGALPLPVPLSQQGGSPLASRRKGGSLSLEGSQPQLRSPGAPAVGNSCLVRLCQARRLDGCLPNDRATAAFTQSPRSNYLENEGHRPHSWALIEFQYLPRAALT